MCHPGLPLPHGDSQYGSSGLDRFHRAKSLGSRLLELPGGNEHVVSYWLTHTLPKGLDLMLLLTCFYLSVHSAHKSPVLIPDGLNVKVDVTCTVSRPVDRL